MKTVTATRPKTKLGCLIIGFSLVFTGVLRSADAPEEPPTGRFYVADSEGISSINTGTKIENLTPKAAYSAQGATLETQSTARIAIVLSNGTGLAFTPDTSLQITRFQQDRFTPNRTNIDAEPSISQFDAILTRGGVGISCSKLSAGSTMSIKSRHATMAIRGGKLFIDVTDTQTTVSLLEGSITIRDELKGGSVPLNVGQQALITRQSPSTPPIIHIQTLAEHDLKMINDTIDLAAMSRRTVYFDVLNTGKPGEERLVPVTVLPGTIPGPNTVSPFRITRTVIR